MDRVQAETGNRNWLIGLLDIEALASAGVGILLWLFVNRHTID